MMKISLTRFRILVSLIILLFLSTPAFTAEKDEARWKEEYVAIVDLESQGEIDKDTALLLSYIIEDIVVKSGKFKGVVDRGKTQRVLEEMKFQYSGLVDPEYTSRLGKMLGATYFITGYVTGIKGSCTVALSLIKVETAEKERTALRESSYKTKELKKAAREATCELLDLVPPPPKNYIVLKGGLYSPKTKNASQNLDSGYSGVIVYGYKLSPYIAFEMEAGLLNTKGSTSNACVSGGGASCVYTYDEKITVFPIMATLKAILPVKAIELYAGGGGGYYLIKDEMDVLLNSSKIASGSASAQSPAFHISGGLNINLGDNLFLGIDGKYVFLEKVELEFSGNYAGKRNIDLTGYIINASLGIRF